MVRRRKDDNVIKFVLVGLVVVAIFYMILSFGGLDTFAIVNVQGKEVVRAGEEQEYRITLRTVNPDQFKTATHYRQQFGRWRIEDADGEIISPGKETEIFQGVYDQFVTLNMPFGQKKLFLIAEINEIQWSAATVDSKFISDEPGNLRMAEKIEINILECAAHSECNVADTCLGQFGFCNEGLCEVRGECHQCIANSDCAELEEAKPGTVYECIDFKCVEFVETTFIEEVKEAFAEPITEPAPVEAGQPPQPKQSPQILSLGVFLMIALVIYLVLRTRGIVK